MVLFTELLDRYLLAMSERARIAMLEALDENETEGAFADAVQELEDARNVLNGFVIRWVEETHQRAGAWKDEAMQAHRAANDALTEVRKLQERYAPDPGPWVEIDPTTQVRRWPRTSSGVRAAIVQDATTSPSYSPISGKRIDWRGAPTVSRLCGWWVYNLDGEHLAHGEEIGQEGRDKADERIAAYVKERRA